jgi:hypothetical protein
MEFRFTPPEALGLNKNEVLINNVMSSAPELRSAILKTYNAKRTNL